MLVFLWGSECLRDKTGEPIATATFQFTTATNHCELERKEKGNAQTEPTTENQI